MHNRITPRQLQRSPAHRRRVVASLLGWYTSHGRSLPWRLPVEPAKRSRTTHSAYRILVSEIMLQQTQVARVTEKYPGFVRRFPSVRRLASARQRDVVVAWKGLGYNNRAVRLHRLARIVVEKHGGRLPETPDALMQLPGVGRYTANALLSSVFGKDAAIVDVNVRRVLSRVFWKMTSTSDSVEEEAVWKLAESLLPKGKTYHWNQALMDLGATVCTARKPRCGQCPLIRWCASAATMENPERRATRSEPSRNGIPNRMYRGRVVDALRQINGRESITGATLIRSMNAQRDIRWLTSLLEGLQRDGVIQVQGKGALHKRRVSLA